MDMLLRREQTDGKFLRVWFKVHAKLEFNEEEQKIIRRYRFDQSVLIDGQQPGLMRNCILAGIAVTVIMGLLFLPQVNYGQSVVFPVLVSIGIGIAAGFGLHHNFRETIYVRDLIHGRHFACPSVVALARKEAYLQSISAYLRQVMESAKHWDGQERMEVLPLPPEEAKRIILTGPLF